jgi:hypothetical protein
MRASEVSAVTNLISGFVRRDELLRESIRKNQVEDYLQGNEQNSGLIDTLNGHIELSGFEESEVLAISVEKIKNDEELYRIEVVIRDHKTNREERSYVVVSLH